MNNLFSRVSLGPLSNVGQAAPTQNAVSTPAQGGLGGLGDAFGGMFGRLGGKNAPRDTNRDNRPQQPTPATPATPRPGIDPYQTLAQPDRQALLQAMLTRARGGQAGGAPTAPLPAPNSQVPTA